MRLERSYLKRDAEFVRTYAKSTLQEMTPFKSQNVYGTKTFSNTTAALSGTISHVDSGVLTYTYGGNLLGQITAGNTPRNMKLTAYVEPFGVIDSSGTIAALARHSVSQSNSNNKVIRMSKTDTYNGACLFYNMYARLDTTTSGGQGFNILCS